MAKVPAKKRLNTRNRTATSKGELAHLWRKLVHLNRRNLCIPQSDWKWIWFHQQRPVWHGPFRVITTTASSASATGAKVNIVRWLFHGNINKLKPNVFLKISNLRQPTWPTFSTFSLTSTNVRVASLASLRRVSFSVILFFKYNKTYWYQMFSCPFADISIFEQEAMLYANPTFVEDIRLARRSVSIAGWTFKPFLSLKPANFGPKCDRFAFGNARHSSHRPHKTILLMGVTRCGP